MAEDRVQSPAVQGRPLRAAVIVGALGVVFGDIGTSPIYTLQTVFNPADPHPVPLDEANVYGVVSLIFWSVTAVVTESAPVSVHPSYRYVSECEVFEFIQL